MISIVKFHFFPEKINWATDNLSNILLKLYDSNLYKLIQTQNLGCKKKLANLIFTCNHEVRRIVKSNE